MKKNTNGKLFCIIFFLIALVDIIGLLMNKPQIRAIFKPLIIVSLGLYYVVSVSKIDKVYLAALFFSFAGDVVLLKTYGGYFLIGIFSFLITQLLYIFILNKDVEQYKIKPLLRASFPFIVTFMTVILFVKESLGNFFIPIFIYAIVITTLGGISFYNFLEKRDRPSMYMAIGVFLFITSDSVLAVEHFMIPYREAELGIIIMFTYVLAQFLICRYMIEKDAGYVKNKLKG